MTLIDRFHALLTRIGISPKVGDPLIVGALGVLASWVESGEFNAGELRLAIASAIWAFVGGVAPPADGVTQADVAEIAERRR